LGYVDVRATIGNPKRTLAEEAQFLVDTGAFHTAIPKIMAENLLLETAGEISITFADKREVKAPIALAYLKVLDRESMVPVVIIDVPRPLLGVSALEGLGLKVDPVSGSLECSRPFGAALL
jgi:aspartyl protease family protein